MKLRKGTYGAPEVRHWGEPATLKVGAYCSIAVDVKIFLGGNHRIDWITTYPFTVARESAKGIKGHPTTKGDVIIAQRCLDRRRPRSFYQACASETAR